MSEENVVVKCKCGAELRTYWVWWERMVCEHLVSVGRHPRKAQEVLAASANDAVLAVQGYRAPYLGHDAVRHLSDGREAVIGTCEPISGQTEG